MSSRAASSAVFETFMTAGRWPSIRNVWSRSLLAARALPTTPKRFSAMTPASASLKEGGATDRTSSTRTDMHPA